MKKVTLILVALFAFEISNAQVVKTPNVSVVATATDVNQFAIANDSHTFAFQVTTTRTGTVAATGTLILQASNDGVNWVNNATSGTDSTTYSDAATTSSWFYENSLAKYGKYRVLIKGAGSGTVTVTGYVNVKK